MNGRSEDQKSHNFSLALSEIQAKITMACLKGARLGASVQLLAVSKTFPAEAVMAFAKLGQRAFGENYLQEALDKQEICMQLDPELAPLLDWHFIGPIQSNKTRPIAEHFSWVHGVEREKIARRLIEQRPSGLDPLNLCLQINISGEASKSGCPPEEATALVLDVAKLIQEAKLSRPDAPIALRGLMCIPESAETEQEQRRPFLTMRKLFGIIQAELRSHDAEQARVFDTLSMGMSADLQAAILEGSTMVRIGSALFGQRNAAQGEVPGDHLPNDPHTKS